MKRLLRKTIHRDNRGLSLVEVLCAVAILSLITGVIGSVIVISARTYRKGISETNIQQEAQLAANNIGNIVKNSYKVVYGDETKALTASSEKEGDEPITGSTLDFTKYTELSLITNEDIQYTILHDKDAETLFYQEYDTANGTQTAPELMARNIKTFSADTSEFKDNRTIKIEMTVFDEDTNRTIPLEYTMTSRNSKGEGEYVSSTDSLKILFLESEVVLVPGESYSIPVSFSKTPTGAVTFEASSGNIAPFDVDMESDMAHVKVTVPLEVTDDQANSGLSFKINADGASSTYFKVHVRKVEKVKVNYTVDLSGIPDEETRTYEVKGSKFTFTAGVSGNRLSKDVAKDYDNGYVPAQVVKWEYKTEIETESGMTEVDKDAYIEVVSTETGAGDFTKVPTLVLKLKQNMPMDFKLTVTATSEHASGANKAGTSYKDYSVALEQVQGHYYDIAEVGPRPVVMDDTYEITLEPLETSDPIDLGIKGGLPKTGDVTFEYSGASDRPNTEAVYDSGTVTVKLGKDEMGSGADATTPYTFRIGVKIKTELKSTIIVHVRRIDKIWVGIVQDKNVEKTYDFRARINVPDQEDNKQMTTDYLYSVKEPDNDEAKAKEKAIVENTLLSKITWEYYVDKNLICSDWVICEAGVGIKGTIIDKGGTGGFKEERDEYSLTKGLKNSVKPARIQFYTETEKQTDAVSDNEMDRKRAAEVEANRWYIRQYPEVDLTLKNGSLPAKSELRVTIEMLHSQGHYDSEGCLVSKYYDKPDYSGKYFSTDPNSEEWEETRGVVYASASIFGNRIYTDSDIVVVEPGQGTNSSIQSDEEMVIPIHSDGEDQEDKIVSSMKVVTIEGNTSENTKWSTYSDKTNPYLDSRSSDDKKSEWYLGLMIDKNEQGDENGQITVVVEAYDKNGKTLTQMDIKLAVRRVNKVEIKEKDERQLKDINEQLRKQLEENNTNGVSVTLEAYPTGKGKNGTEYYGVQTKNVTDGYKGFDITMSDDQIDAKDSPACRWEKKDHGRYISPLKMNWTLTCDGKTLPVTVENWPEYFSKVKIEEIGKKEEKDANNKNTIAKSVLTFTLKKELPSNAKFRATSLHTLGKVKGSNTKYNKAGQSYGEKYDEWPKAGLITVSGGWKRGGVLDIAYNIPPENITYVDGKPFLVKDGQTLWDGAIATKISFKSKYNGANQEGNHLFQSPSFFTHNPYDNGAGVGGERGEAYFEGKTLTEYTATIYAWGDRLENISYSSPYTKGNGAYIDLSTIEMKVNVGTTDVDATNTIAVEERTFEIPDVVFQYQNALPDTSKQKGDSDGAWTNKNGNNTLKVYVTPDDTISSYKSYYKLSEGWEETYEKYTLLTSRYVGVITDNKKDDSLDERLFDFTVTNTTGEGDEEGRSYVEFEFTKDVRTQNKGKVVKMIYEYNPYLCNTNNNDSAPYAWAYGGYKKEQLDEIDGCEGILEFHFVDANIKAKSGVTMPEVRYCPTYSENKSSATPNYYYISDTERFYIDSNGTDAQYQTGSAGNWTTKCSMTYANDKWTIQ